MRGKTRKPIDHIEYGRQVRDIVILPLRLGPAPQQVGAGRVEVRVVRRGPGAPNRVPPPLHKSHHGAILARAAY
jgi:hypothetical protein